MGKIGIIYSDRYLDHETGTHVENSGRVRAIREALLEAPWSGRLDWLEPRAATPDEVAMIHDRHYIAYVRRACESTRGISFLNPDTAVSPMSYEVALLAAGGVFEGIDRVATGGIDGFFALVRPPGHHAESDESLGFCLFNNIAVGARYAQEKHGVGRVFILDWDVHHGNGTQDSFYGSRDVLYFSSHQYPFYPGTGRLHETGSRGAEGFTVNCPLGGGRHDGEYLAVYNRVLVPIIESFEPGLILVSAGFDAHSMDPIGGMRVSTGGFAALAALIMDAARRVNSPVVYALEGGYNFDALRDSVKAVLDVMKGGSAPAIEQTPCAELDEIVGTHARYWPL